jgi:predicted phosphodiesterase
VRLGLISDIHGNTVALDAVIADGSACGVDAWWVLGDLAAIGPRPVATLERLVDLPGVAFVRGNTDRYVVTGDRPPPTAADVAADSALAPVFDQVEASFSWTAERLRERSWSSWLAALPAEQRLDLPDGTRLLGVHASLGRDDGPGINETSTDDELGFWMQAAGADLICGGHTHRPVDRTVGAVRAVNLGSVSNPVTDDRRAGYVVIDADRHGHSVHRRLVAYDNDAVVDQLWRCDHPAAGWIAQMHQPASTA